MKKKMSITYLIIFFLIMSNNILFDDLLLLDYVFIATAKHFETMFWKVLLCTKSF